MNNEISKTENFGGTISRATQTETIIRCIYCDTICYGEVCPAEGKQCDLCGDIGHIRAACLRNF
ncbi:CLUMA_CG003613, isoform A [Clunio marinus]|uniref:CLUMA_CG003613, isoform A n=1 Tax=Clunio marinus TaxID=568069 RepID=A0A1J1HNX9_9DIPT|nr:CLUMA_CG003613, isoform A [Clunio marinus]